MKIEIIIREDTDEKCTRQENCRIKTHVRNVGNSQIYSWGRERKLVWGEGETRED